MIASSRGRTVPRRLVAALAVVLVASVVGWLALGDRQDAPAGSPSPTTPIPTTPSPTSAGPAARPVLGGPEVRLAKGPITDTELGSVTLTKGANGQPLAVTVSHAAGGMLDVVNLRSGQLLVHRALVHDTAMRGTALNKGFAVLPDGRVLMVTTRAELFILDPRGYGVIEVTPIGRQITAGPPSASPTSSPVRTAGPMWGPTTAMRMPRPSSPGAAAGTDGTYVFDLVARRWSDVEPGRALGGDPRAQPGGRGRLCPRWL
jgi:hypothetical protein